MPTPKVPFIRSDFLSLLELLARGWTRHLIDGRLGSPDKTRLEPLREGGRSRSLFARARVEVAETAEGMPERLAAQREKQEQAAAAKAAPLQALRAEQEAAEAVILAGLPQVTVPLEPKRAARVLCQHFTAREVRALVSALTSGNGAR